MAAYRRALNVLLALVVLVATALPSLAADQSDHAALIAELIRPKNLATLGERGANPRVQKAVYWLAVAQQGGKNPQEVAEEAAKLARYKKPLARELTAKALVRNLDIAKKLGCLDTAGLAEMRRGRSPTIRAGPYRDDELSVDHIIPYAVCPQLDKVIANLELMPLRMNQSKNDKVGDRQLQTAEELHRAGLLSATRLKKIRRAAK